jgi:threonine dehydrogenase-like Zn-dependent dehydrogenase
MGKVPMRAPVFRGGNIRVCEMPMPEPGDGQILARSLACGICASDLHFMDDPLGASAADPGGLWNYDPNADIVMGHEYCAEIVAYGPGTARRWPIGTRVASIPVLIRPNAVRIVGYSADAPGAFGQYFLMSEAVTQQVRGDLPSELVATSDAIAVGWFYAKRAAITAREIPLVIGCGAIGLAVIASLRRLGIGPIVAVDFSAERRALAQVMGADTAIDPAARSPYGAWRELAYGAEDIVRGAFGAADLPRCVIFECVGRPGVLESIVRACEAYARILSAGGCPEGDHIPSPMAHVKGLNLQFGGGPQMADWNEALDEVCSGRINVAPLVGELVSLDDVPDALNRARGPHAPARIIIQPNR